MKTNYLIIFFILISVFLSESCTENPATEHEGKVFRYNESKGISGLDPAFARNLTIIWPVSQIYNGLVQMDDSLNVIPCIAKDWEISDNGKVYTFYLRDDVYFHENDAFGNKKTRKVTAYDFVYSFKRIIDPKTASPGRWVFSALDVGNINNPDGFHALNDTVFRIWLKDPFPPFSGILTMPYCYVVPKEALSFYKDDFAVNPVGTGPFQFALWRRDEKLVLTKNDNYFEFDDQGTRLPYIDAVAISFIKDKQSEFMEFLSGNLDFLSGVHATYKDELLTRSGKLDPGYTDRFTLYTQPYLNIEYLGFLVDTSLSAVKSSPLKIAEVRKAINYGFDRVKMMKYLRNNIGKPALHGFVPYGLQAYNTDAVTGYSYVPDSVRYLLKKAGFPEGKGLGDILLTTTSDYLDICEYIQYELSKFGINISIDVATGGNFRNKVANSNLLFFRGSWIADYPDAENYLSLFYSGNKSPKGPNYTQFSNKKFDHLYKKALSENDPEKRNLIYQKADQLVINEAAVVPLYYDEVLRIVPSHIKGFHSNPLNSLVIKYVNMNR